MTRRFAKTSRSARGPCSGCSMRRSFYAAIESAGLVALGCAALAMWALQVIYARRPR